ncbi:MAG: formate dehydrogenase accessory sulfurtransferase FdhD [Deltaproteobacteria bacterium]|nr:formate dehydrogenase accessory sulfurtransferase FdhD [Deltaproteobacteria bacterium]
MNKSQPFSAFTYEAAGRRWQSLDLALIAEIPLQIWINGEHLVTLHRTPGNELFLAAGYLYYQGLISAPEDITAQRLIRITSEASSPLANDSLRLTIKTPSTAISALTAGAIWTIIQPQSEKPRIKPLPPPASRLTELPEKMRQRQQLYQTTAGAHAVALVDETGEILHCEEDVGRTNALDKLVGYCLCQKIDMTTRGAVFSGRINLEMAVKIIRAGFPLVFSFSAPTAGAVRLLKLADITYAGSLRAGSFTLFCGSL